MSAFALKLEKPDDDMIEKMLMQYFITQQMVVSSDVIAFLLPRIERNLPILMVFYRPSVREVWRPKKNYHTIFKRSPSFHRPRYGYFRANAFKPSCMKFKIAKIAVLLRPYMSLYEDVDF